MKTVGYLRNIPCVGSSRKRDQTKQFQSLWPREPDLWHCEQDRQVALSIVRRLEVRKQLLPSKQMIRNWEKCKYVKSRTNPEGRNISIRCLPGSVGGRMGHQWFSDVWELFHIHSDLEKEQDSKRIWNVYLGYNFSCFNISQKSQRYVTEDWNHGIRRNYVRKMLL